MHRGETMPKKFSTSSPQRITGRPRRKTHEK